MCNCQCCGQSPVKISSDDITYSGSFLSTLNILPNEDLTSIIVKINSYLASLVTPTNYTITGGVNDQTANGLSLVYNIPHNLGSIPSTYTVEAHNSNTNPDFFITTDSTNIKINFSIAPSQGSQISFVWSATKL